MKKAPNKKRNQKLTTLNDFGNPRPYTYKPEFLWFIQTTWPNQSRRSSLYWELWIVQRLQRHRIVAIYQFDSAEPSCAPSIDSMGSPAAPACSLSSGTATSTQILNFRCSSVHKGGCYLAMWVSSSCSISTDVGNPATAMFAVLDGEDLSSPWLAMLVVASSLLSSRLNIITLGLPFWLAFHVFLLHAVVVFSIGCCKTRLLVHRGSRRGTRDAGLSPSATLHYDRTFFAIFFLSHLSLS